MSKIWTFMIIVSLVLAITVGNVGNITNIIMDSSALAVENIVKLAGMMCFWSGIFNILSSTNLVKKLSKFTSRVLKKLFSSGQMSDEAMENISLNVTSNVIGVGNVATVYGIKAVEELNKLNHDKNRANDNMIMFVLINTASIQLIPTGIITLRAMYHSKDVTCIVLPILIVSIVALTVGIIACKIVNKIIK